MTPEERAREIADGWNRLPGRGITRAVVSDIAAAIRAAVEEEREACARLADYYEFAGQR